MSVNSRRGFLTAVLHPLFAVLIPLVFFVLVTEILRDLAVLRLTPAVYLFLLLAGIEEVVAGNILFEERIGSFDRLREPIYLIAFLGAVLMLFVPGVPSERLRGLLRPDFIYLGLLVLLQWMFSWRIHHALREREMFEGSLEGKEGADLKHVIRENAELARMAISAVPRIRRSILLFQVVAFAGVVALFAAGLRVSSATAVLFLVHGLLGLGFAVLLNNAVHDQMLSAEGIALGDFYRRRRSVYALSILALSLVFVLLYARNTSLLPLSLFRPFLDWLASLFDRERPVARPPRILTQTPRPEADLFRRLQLEDSGPSPLMDLLRYLLRVIWKVVRLFALLTVAYFVISPFLSRYFRARLGGLKPLEFLREQGRRLLQSLRTVLADFMAWLRRPAAERRRERHERRKWVGQVRLRRPGLFQRMQMGRLLRAYVKLIRWGERRGVAFRTPYAPQEYAFMVAERAPEHREALREAIAVLEEALFSPHRVPRERVGVYLRTIREITGKRV